MHPESDDHPDASNPPDGRPARQDEVAPSEEMREADRANGEPDATESTNADDPPSDPPSDEAGE